MHRVGHNTYFLCFAIFNTNSMSAECVLIKHDLVHETRDANLFKHFPESVSGVCFFIYILHDTLLCLKLHVEPTHSSDVRLFPLFITCQIQHCMFLPVILIYCSRKTYSF